MDPLPTTTPLLRPLFLSRMKTQSFPYFTTSLMRVSQGGPCSLVPFQNFPMFPCSHTFSECFLTVIFRILFPCSQKLVNVPLFPSIFCQCSLVPQNPWETLANGTTLLLRPANTLDFPVVIFFIILPLEVFGEYLQLFGGIPRKIFQRFYLICTLNIFYGAARTTNN